MKPSKRPPLAPDRQASPAAIPDQVRAALEEGRLSVAQAAKEWDIERTFLVRVLFGQLPRGRTGRVLAGKDERYRKLAVHVRSDDPAAFIREVEEQQAEATVATKSDLEQLAVAVWAAMIGKVSLDEAPLVLPLIHLCCSAVQRPGLLAELRSAFARLAEPSPAPVPSLAFVPQDASRSSRAGEQKFWADRLFARLANAVVAATSTPVPLAVRIRIAELFFVLASLQDADPRRALETAQRLLPPR
jgi:hypothetical protein